MILVDNRNVLRIKDRGLLNRISEVENSDPTGNVIVEQARTGVPTLKIAVDGKMQYVHSKYDPEKDAKRLIDKFEGESVNHVLFVGVGLGYHIRAFAEVHPDTKFSIYEPDEEVLVNYLSHVKLDELRLQNLSQIFTGIDSDNLANEIQKLLQMSNSMLKIIVLPVYEKVYGEQIVTITNEIVDTLKSKRSSLAVDVSFQKRWTVNSIKNFPMVLKTPNILHHMDRIAFEGKPAIIVAAGPSLNEEFENLRYIKENGLAYIFSVGSAINALIEHGIYPDAACTYDPKERNQNVIKIIKERDITSIPLIFGSSVGYETLENYPGEMLHMITSQDTVSQYLLKNDEELQIVYDAPSIAVITFQMLSLLGFGQIILVGQNLSFLNKQRFADGIKYGHISNTISADEEKKLLLVRDVTGQSIYTDESYNSMRQQLEMYIKKYSNVKVINTTVSGAHIEGTDFVRLSTLINDTLKEKVFQNDWSTRRSGYSITRVDKNIKVIEKELIECNSLFQKALNELKNISQLLSNNNLKQLERIFPRLDREIDKMKGNLFFQSYIEPMIRVQYHRLIEKTQEIRYEKDLLKKGKIILALFHNFIMDCHRHYLYVVPLFQELKSKVIEEK